LIIVGFSGILTFEDILEISSVEASTTRFVGGIGPSNFSTIGKAISLAQPGDTINVFGGIYRENLVIDKSLNLIGSKNGTTIIDGFRNGTVIKITANYVNITGFTVINSSKEGHLAHAGIMLFNINNATIKKNNCSNNLIGIRLVKSNFNVINNNIFYNNEDYSIINDHSKSNVFLNNTFINCSFYLYGEILQHYNSHTIPSNNTINTRPLYYLKNRNSYKVPPGAGHIILVNCTNISIENQSISKTNYGIEVYYSKDITIKNNRINFNFCGIYIKHSNNNFISNNICNNNHWPGISLLFSNYNILKDNTCNSNFYDGIGLNSFSNWNIIENNTCKFNGYGIAVGYTFYAQNGNCNNNFIINNTCKHNSDGMKFYGSKNNSIINNIIMNNGRGIKLENSQKNILNNIVCNMNNFTGIDLINSHNNTLSSNLISNNNYGLNLYFDEYGYESKDNLIYHNNFNSNNLQVYETNLNNNIWNNTNQEGNYWSDYNGSDTGNMSYSWDITNKHLIRGDGIGDTLVPHLGLDYYPLTNRTGWLIPGTPTLIDPIKVDNDGNYSLNWNSTIATMGYILEEDDSLDFNSPIEIYNGSNHKYNFSNKVNGTYYYRVKAYNEKYSGKWSNIVNIIVDWLPEIPINFTTYVDPQGNMIKLNWNLNLKDTKEYLIEFKNEKMIDWQQLEPILHPRFFYNHTNLIDGILYNYRIQAKDHRGQLSNYSEFISGIPKDTLAPSIPKNFEIKQFSDTHILLSWTENQDFDLVGYQIFMKYNNQNKTFEDFELIKTIRGYKTEFTVTGLSEQINYTFKIRAFDEVPNYSNFSKPAWAITPDITHPSPPTRLEIINTTNDSLTMSWIPSKDIDVIGYVIYRCESLSGNYINISSLINQTIYIDIVLDEDTYYYYKIKAIDDYGLESLFTDPIMGKTMLGPRAPIVNKTIEIIELMEDPVDNFTINLKDWFNDPNQDTLIFNYTGQKHINISIDQETGLASLIPTLNWNGEEIITFYANDGIFETSIIITISVNSVNDHPFDIKIIQPKNNMEINENTKIDLIGTCKDPDLLFNDSLQFIWSSSIDGILGKGSELNNITPSKGEHIIRLEVSDKYGESIETSINLTILEKNDDTSEEGFNVLQLSSMFIIILTIIIIILVLSVIKKKKEKNTVTLRPEPKHIQTQDSSQESEPPHEEQLEE
jgi:parallel beta-helix repeat protein